MPSRVCVCKLWFAYELLKVKWRRIKRERRMPDIWIERERERERECPSLRGFVHPCCSGV
jgi:hypothetical protein